MLDTLFARRSIRKYTAEPVSEEQVRTILEAAMAAPSGSNLQPWHFVVVRDRAMLRHLADTHQWAKMAADAALVIVVCGDAELSSRHWVEDCSAATENLLLAVTALGLGAVWVALYPSDERQECVREMLDIPSKMGVLCLVPIGHPAEEKPPRTQYDEARVHSERW